MNWIKVEDEMPPSAGYSDCKTYLIWHGYASIAYYYDDKWVDDPIGFYSTFRGVTHWMDIIDPFKQEP